MKLQTVVVPKKEGVTIAHTDDVLLIGSCFTDSIGQKLEHYSFRCFRNPFGILYNPFSIAVCLEYCLDNKVVETSDLVYQNCQWHSWLHHSCYSHTSATQCIDACNAAITKAHNFLKTANYIILTWGTALAYHLKEKNIVVGNCHKVPASNFDRRLLSVDEIVCRYVALEEKLHAINPKAKIILTVSPIRHWKEGYRENQLSKSVLHLAVDKLQRQSDTYCYFPSYEIVMDELRDYRFFEADMLHPSAVAVEVIWEKFLDTYASDCTKDICMLVDKYRKMAQHRPFNPEGEEYQAHCRKTVQLKERLKDLLGREI